MSRWWMWWRPVDDEPVDLEHEIQQLADELAAANRETNQYARQLAGAQYALERREAALAAAQQAGVDLGDKLQQAEGQRDAAVARLDRVAAVVANDRLSPAQLLSQVQQVLTEGGDSDG